MSAVTLARDLRELMPDHEPFDEHGIEGLGARKLQAVSGRRRAG